jgi:hypothetical protein
MITANLMFTPPPAAVKLLQPAYMPVWPSMSQRKTLFFTFVIARIAHTVLQSYLSKVRSPMTLHRYASYLLAGTTFSFGLLISGMANPVKVLRFLTIRDLRIFDPSLAMVVLSGVIPNAVHWYNMQKGKTRLSWEKWSVPSRSDIDWQLIVGSAVFGIGWGLAGICPGPAVVGLGSLVPALVRGEVVTEAAKTMAGFVGSMLAGMTLVKFI